MPLVVPACLPTVKQKGKRVTYNDLLRFNYYIGLALIENKQVRLTLEEVDWLFIKHPDITYPRFIQDNFHDIYFTIFDNGQANRALNFDAVDVPGKYDLVYVDTPYISKCGVAVDYLSFYHFLEGLTMYDEWGKHIDYKSKHRRLISEWTDKKRIHTAFESNYSSDIRTV